MKNNFIVLSSVVLIGISSNRSFANKIAIQGENISSDKINSSVFQIGSIQQAMLTETQFQSLNGDCWKLMDGSSLAGTDYGNFTGMTNLPNMVANGEFLRQAKSGRTLGSLELDDFKSHTHVQNSHYHNESMGYSSSGYWGNDAVGVGAVFFNNGDGYTSNSNRTRLATATNQNTGGTETRPRNIAVNFFIKVNKNCNFN